MAEQTINDVSPNTTPGGTAASPVGGLQPELLTAYRLMLEYQFFGAVCLIIILCLALLAIYLMRLDPPILALVTLAGVLGAFFSALTRLYNVDQASIALISPTVSKLGGRYLLMYSLVPPIIGAIASVVIYVIFIAGLLGDGRHISADGLQGAAVRFGAHHAAGFRPEGSAGLRQGAGLGIRRRIL